MPRAAPSVTICTVRGVGEQVALLERVGGVLLPGVLGVHRGQRGVDAAGGQRGVRVGLRPLADGEDVDAPLGELDRRAQPGSSGADHENGGGDLLFGVGHVPLLVWSPYDRQNG